MSHASPTANRFGTLTPPANIPELVVVPTRTALFMFSAVTWNRHRIHYSLNDARREGHDDVLVQRALLGNYMARMLTDWLGGAGDVRRLEWKVVASAVPDRPLHCRGTVVERAQEHGRDLARCELAIVDESGVNVALGKATVELFAGERA